MNRKFEKLKQTGQDLQEVYKAWEWAPELLDRVWRRLKKTILWIGGIATGGMILNENDVLKIVLDLIKLLLM